MQRIYDEFERVGVPADGVIDGSIAVWQVQQLRFRVEAAESARDVALARAAAAEQRAEPAERERLSPESLRAVFTNEVIRAVGALARQQNVCREQGGKVAFVTGMDAAREYIVEQIQAALPSPPARAKEGT